MGETESGISQAVAAAIELGFGRADAMTQMNIFYLISSQTGLIPLFQISCNFASAQS